MTPSDDEIQNEEELAKKKKKGEGEGETGQAGAVGSSVDAAVTDEDAARRTAKVAKLSTEKNKQVWAEFIHHDINAIMTVVAEFFTEWPMRAAANLKVDWNKVAGSSKSFAIINWTVEVGAKALRDMVRSRERTRGADSNGLKRKRSFRPGVKPSSDPNNGPVGAG